MLVAPPSILLSQKMMTVMLRKREKGRDLFDVSVLLGATQPDFVYLAKCLGLEKTEIVAQFSQRLEQMDLRYLAADVEPFLFYPEQKERVLTFPQYWEQCCSGF